MIDFESVFTLQSLTIGELVFRTLVAMTFGLLLGLDRDTKNKPIDFRAYMLVTVTTCLLMILTQELHQVLLAENNALSSLDYAKVISGVVTGIGFLGAGAIIHKSDDRVVGTATGASIWAAGGMGMAIGLGFYTIAIVAFVAIASTLVIGGMFMCALSGRNDREIIKDVEKENE